MPKGHYLSAGGSIDYGDADVLFPPEELDASIRTHRDAQLALEGADSSEVVIISPTSLATSYALNEYGLAVIPLENLSKAIQSRLNTALEKPIESFELVQIGRWNRDAPDHSLTEFTRA